MSGSVAVVAHIDGPMLNIASVGDCTAVLGSLSENETWSENVSSLLQFFSLFNCVLFFRVAKKLTTEHNSDNLTEVKRILSEHPKEEERDIIRGDRLLGILAPLRFKEGAQSIFYVIYLIFFSEPSVTLFLSGT